MSSGSSPSRLRSHLRTQPITILSNPTLPLIRPTPASEPFLSPSQSIILSRTPVQPKRDSYLDPEPPVGGSGAEGSHGFTLANRKIVGRYGNYQVPNNNGSGSSGSGSSSGGSLKSGKGKGKRPAPLELEKSFRDPTGARKRGGSSGSGSGTGSSKGSKGSINSSTTPPLRPPDPSTFTVQRSAPPFTTITKPSTPPPDPQSLSPQKPTTPPFPKAKLQPLRLSSSSSFLTSSAMVTMGSGGGGGSNQMASPSASPRSSVILVGMSRRRSADMRGGMIAVGAGRGRRASQSPKATTFPPSRGASPSPTVSRQPSPELYFKRESLSSPKDVYFRRESLSSPNLNLNLTSSPTPNPSPKLKEFILPQIAKDRRSSDGEKLAEKWKERVSEIVDDDGVIKWRFGDDERIVEKVEAIRREGRMRRGRESLMEEGEEIEMEVTPSPSPSNESSYHHHRHRHTWNPSTPPPPSSTGHNLTPTTPEAQTSHEHDIANTTLVSSFLPSTPSHSHDTTEVGDYEVLKGVTGEEIEGAVFGSVSKRVVEDGRGRGRMGGDMDRSLSGVTVFPENEGLVAGDLALSKLPPLPPSPTSPKSQSPKSTSVVVHSARSSNSQAQSQSRPKLRAQSGSESGSSKSKSGSGGEGRKSRGSERKVDKGKRPMSFSGMLGLNGEEFELEGETSELRDGDGDLEKGVEDEREEENGSTKSDSIQKRRMKQQQQQRGSKSISIQIRTSPIAQSTFDPSISGPSPNLISSSEFLLPLHSPTTLRTLKVWEVWPGERVPYGNVVRKNFGSWWRREKRRREKVERGEEMGVVQEKEKEVREEEGGGMGWMVVGGGEMGRGQSRFSEDTRRTGRWFLELIFMVDVSDLVFF